MKYLKSYEKSTENRQVGDIVKCISSKNSSLIFHNCYTISKISDDKDWYRVAEDIPKQINWWWSKNRFITPKKDEIIEHQMKNTKDKYNL